MKKYINKMLRLSIGASVLLSLGSCSKDYLDVEHYAALTPDYMSSDNQGLKDAITACYANMNQMTNEDLMKPNLWLGCHPTMDTQATGWDKAWLTQSWSSETKELYDEWKRLYDGIACCNDLIYALENNTNPELDKELVKQGLAEAKAMRGYYYLWLAENWGKVPILKPGKNFFNLDQQLTNSSYEEVLNEVIADLKAAADVLDWTPRDNQYGRATKGMALSFLADAYLWKAYRSGNPSGDDANVKEAKKCLKEVIESGTYQLEPSFATLFDPKAWNKESIWEEVVDEGQSSHKWTDYQTNAHGWEFNYAACMDNGGWGTLYLSWEWYFSFEKGDKRRDGSCCTDNIANFGDFKNRITDEPLKDCMSEITYGVNPYISEVASTQDSYHYSAGGDYAPAVWSTKFWRVSKNYWWDAGIYNPCHVYWKRYSNVLLTYAECCFRTGEDGWAYIDQVRQRAFGNDEVGVDPSTIDSYTQLYRDAAKWRADHWQGDCFSEFNDYPVPFEKEEVEVPAAETYYGEVKSKLGFNLETWQVALIQERRKEFNAEWCLAPDLHRAGLLAEHIRCNYPKDATPISALKDYPWTPRDYDYSEEKMDFPIPANELTLNPNLKQNKGY